MADDKSNTDEPDRSKVADGQHYEVKHLAEQAGLTAKQARTLIRKHGNDRQALMTEARKIRGR